MVYGFIPVVQQEHSFPNKLGMCAVCKFRLIFSKVQLFSVPNLKKRLSKRPIPYMNIATNVICFGAQKKFIILYLKHPFLKTNSSDVLSKESPLVSIALCYTTWTDISIVFHLIRE